MPKMSALKFLNYTVQELHFQNIPIDSISSFELHPKIEQELSMVNPTEELYDLKFSIKIEPSENHPLPFELRAVLTGHFKFVPGDDPQVEEIKDHILKKNTVTILFPYVRALITSLTAMANIPPLVLPIMNFSDVSALTSENKE